MIFQTKEEYLAPTIDVMVVRCEAGFLNSTDGIDFEDATDDGWEDL